MLLDIAISLWPRENPWAGRSLSWPVGKPGISDSSAEYSENMPFRTMPMAGLKALSDAGLEVGSALMLCASASRAPDSRTES